MDLQDAYLQVPIHTGSRRDLQFTMAGVSFQFRVLCVELNTAPQVFTRLMAPCPPFPVVTVSESSDIYTISGF